MFMAKFIVTLAALSRADLARAGGKAANLGELRRAGLYVLQARSITQLQAEPVSLAAAVRPLWAYLVRFREMTPGTISPLGATLFARALVRMGEGFAAQGLLPSRVISRFSAFVQPRRGRLYANVSFMRDYMWPVTDEVSLVNLIEGGPWPPLRLGRYSLAALALVCTAPPRLLRIWRYLRHLDRHAQDAIAAMENVLAPLERQSLREWPGSSGSRR